MFKVMRGAWGVMALLAVVVPAFGQGKELQRANRLDCSVIGTNNWVVFSNQASLVFTVSLDNFSGNDVYLMVFESQVSGTNAVAGDRPASSAVKVLNGTTGGFSWGAAGAPFNSLCIAASTTPYRLTNAAAGLGIMSVTRRRDP